MALGYLSTFGESFAKAVIEAKGIVPILKTFSSSSISVSTTTTTTTTMNPSSSSLASISDSEEAVVKNASAWTLGQIAKHGEWFSRQVAKANTLCCFGHNLSKTSTNFFRRFFLASFGRTNQNNLHKITSIDS